MKSVGRPEAGPGPDDLISRVDRGVVSTSDDRSALKEVRTGCRTEGRGPASRGPELARPPLTLIEAAVYLNVTERYMRRLVAERRIPFFKVGRLLRFATTDLDAYLEACRIEPSSVHPLLRRR
jgi:excisionase family DNA binding protein